MVKIMKIFLAISISVLLLSCMCSCNFMGAENEMEGTDLEIYNKLVKTATDPVTMQYSDIFAFDWEKAYVQTDPEMEQEELDRQLGFDSGLVKYDVFWGYPMRIVFVKGEKVVYEFKFERSCMEFGNKGGWIFPDDTVTVSAKDKTVHIAIKNGN